MALRTTYADVVDMARDEARLSTSSSRGTDALAYIQRLVKRHYTTLAEEFEWAHLELKRNDSAARKVLAAGSRIYSFPTSVNVLKITGAYVKHAGVWNPVAYGIGRAEYSLYDPAEDQRNDPVQRWAFHDDDEFEVWPIPASNGAADSDGEVAFEGQRKVEALTSDASRLDMDDEMVALFVAAEILAGNGQKTAAEVKANAAVARRDRMRIGLGDKRTYTMGAGMRGQQYWPRHPVWIRR